MRILIVTPTMGVGGNERIVIALARGLAGDGHAVALFGGTGALESELVDVELERVVVRDRGRSRAGALWSALRLAAWIVRGRPDVVHAINPRMTAIARVAVRLAAPRRPPPIVSSFGNCPPADRPAAARILGGSDAACAASRELGEELVAAGLPRDRLRVLPPGVPVAQPVPESARALLDAELALGPAPVVLAVGRLVEQKNHARLLTAAALVCAELPCVRFLIAGEGPLRAGLERQATDLGLDAHVRFLGGRRDVPALLARCDLVAFSSDWEGLSVAALEALAAGTPIVTTPAEGMRELLAGGAGCAMPDFDAETLAHGMLELLRDDLRRAEMGRRGIDLVASRYSADAMVESHLALYRELRAGRGSDTPKLDSSTQRT